MTGSAEYGSAARSLAINEPSPPSTPMLERARPSWNRRRSSASAQLNSRPKSAMSEAVQKAIETGWWAIRLFKSLSWWQRILVVVVLVTINVLLILFLVYNQQFLAWLHPKAVAWSEKPGGWVLVWGIIFICGFPPTIGYSSMLTLSGFIYGMWPGWLIVATANVAGSLAAFIVCRHFLSSWVERKFASMTQFQALSLVLKHDGVKLLTMVRLCPLPYSASNGALSTFPTITPQAFALATALATPKLLLHLFVGSRLGHIGEDGENMDTTGKAINYISIIVSMILSGVTSVLIYRRTQARTHELEMEEQAKLEEREAALAHPDVFADDDAEEYDDEAIISRTSGDDIDFLHVPEPYRDDASDRGENK